MGKPSVSTQLMVLENNFTFCPSCASKEIEILEQRKLVCNNCFFTFYFNVAISAAVIVENKNKILFTVRNNQPLKGMLDLPGGFVDPQETAEHAAKRELKEELDLDLEESDLIYLGTYPNIYPYKGVNYSTCDLVYLLETKIAVTHFDADEISDILWLDKAEINLEKVGFVSLKNALKTYLEKEKIY